jgi:hypothetical protein
MKHSGENIVSPGYIARSFFLSIAISKLTVAIFTSE